MNEQDKEYLEALYRGFALVGFLMNGDYTVEEIPHLCRRLGKAMMEEPESEEGIVKIKRVWKS